MEITTIQEMDLAQKVDNYYSTMSVDIKRNKFYMLDTAVENYNRDDEGLWQVMQVTDKIAPVAIPLHTGIMYSGRHEDAVAELVKSPEYENNNLVFGNDTNMFLKKVEPIYLNKGK